MGMPAANTDKGNHADSLVSEAGEIRVRRCRYGLMAYINNDPYMGRSFDMYGEFSPGEAKLFKQILRPGMTVLDVGANIGAHTVLFAQSVGPRGRVIAYEPQRVIHQILCANVALNGYLNVQPRNAAAGSEPSQLFVPPVDYTGGGNYGSLALGKWNEGEKVPVETIDSLNLSALHFVKIDVEGMETEVLRGATETLRRHRPILYVENDRRDNSAKLINQLFSMDYRLYWHLSHYYTADNYFGNSNNVFPNIISINMLCIPKESAMKIEGAREIKSADEDWKVVPVTE